MKILLFGGAILLLSCTGTARPAAPASLGQVRFANSCKPNVQGRFLQGVALLHSFEFPEAEQAFALVEKDDPKCVIAAWGMALAKTERNGANAPRKVLAAGWVQLQPWLALKAGTEREQMYIAAVRALYEGYDRTSADVRGREYLDRMEALRRKYPHDINASLLYALALAFSAGPGDAGLERRREALAILLPIFREHPNNPGAAHYIIHAADTPELAYLALPAARKYAAIAPDSPHALHMPSHIFNRLGDWQASIHSNLASARAAVQWIAAGRDAQFDELHALNNLEYAYLQMGEDEQARDTIRRIGEIAAKPGGDPWVLLEAEIYFDLDTHDWSDALRLQPPPQSKPDDNFEIYWAQTMAAARLGRPADAATSLARFRQSLAGWERAKGQAWDVVWKPVFDLAMSEAEAWTLFSQGRQEQAIRELTDAARFEKSHPMYYADVLPRPSSEVLGDMLSEMGRPAEALAAYQAALELAPNRLDSLLGAMKAAETSGNAQLAAEYAGKIRAEGGVMAERS